MIERFDFKSIVDLLAATADVVSRVKVKPVLCQRPMDIIRIEFIKQRFEGRVV